LPISLSGFSVQVWLKSPPFTLTTWLSSHPRLSWKIGLKRPTASFPIVSYGSPYSAGLQVPVSGGMGLRFASWQSSRLS
jgi:hypothetical protein